MGEYEGYNPKEAKLQEFGKLSDTMEKEETKIEDGTDTSAEQLDRYLAAAAAFYHWRAQNPEPEDSPTDRETRGVLYLKFQRALNGSYYKEKADFALETALNYKNATDRRRKHLQHEDIREDVREAFTAQNAESREVAANWFDVTANCLRMPTERPQTPGQQENTP